MLRPGLAVAAMVLTLSFSAPAASSKSEELLQQGNAAYRKRDMPGAIDLFTQAIAADGSNWLAYYNRGRLHDTAGRPGPALDDFNQLLKIKPDHSATLQLRAFMHLRQGRVPESIADFDQAIKVDPQMEPYAWQRGVACYYAGRFADARAQFEKYHAFRTNDVEVILWHFASVARAEGEQKARAALLPAARDYRVPLNEIHAFLSGQGQSEDILMAVNAGKPGTNELGTRRFNAHFYLGLCHEALGHDTLAREHLEQAVTHALPGRFMDDVARQHFARLTRTKVLPKNQEP